MKKKIFLTGSSGRIGSFLKKKLQKDYVVIGSDINVRNNLIDKKYINDVIPTKTRVRKACSNENGIILLLF